MNNLRLSNTPFSHDSKTYLFKDVEQHRSSDVRSSPTIISFSDDNSQHSGVIINLTDMNVVNTSEMSVVNSSDDELDNGDHTINQIKANILINDSNNSKFKKKLEFSLGKI